MNENTSQSLNPVYLTRDQLINNTPNPYKNRPATEVDLEQMKQWLDNYDQTIKINQADTGTSAEAILQMEIKLGITMPPELKLLYSYVGNCPNLITPAGVKKMDYKLLPVDELAVKKEIEVLNFYADTDEVWYTTDILIYGTNLKNKPEYGVDLVNGWQLRCVKNKWYWLKDSMPLYKELCVSIVCIAISHMNNIFQARLKNTYKKFIYDKQYDGFMEWFTGLENYDHALYYNKTTGAFAWKRSVDIFFGCNDKLFTDEFVAKFELKAKYERYEE